MENTPISYRAATKNDIELLARTRVEFFADMKNDITDGQKAAAYPRMKAYFEESFKNDTFTAFLAFDGDFLAGTSGINFYMTPPTLKAPTGKTAYISNVFTKAGYRGRGIATRLFEMTVDEARKRGCDKVTLHATEMGRPIYEKYGFLASSGMMEYYIAKD